VLLVAVVVLEFGSDNSFMHLHWNLIDKLRTNRRVQDISNSGLEIICFCNILITCMRISSSALSEVNVNLMI